MGGIYGESTAVGATDRYRASVDTLQTRANSGQRELISNKDTPPGRRIYMGTKHEDEEGWTAPRGG